MDKKLWRAVEWHLWAHRTSTTDACVRALRYVACVTRLANRYTNAHLGGNEVRDEKELRGSHDILNTYLHRATLGSRITTIAKHDVCMQGNHEICNKIIPLDSARYRFYLVLYNFTITWDDQIIMVQHSSWNVQQQ